VQADFLPREIGEITVKTDVSRLRTPIVRLQARFSDGSTVDGRLTSLTDGQITMKFPPIVTSSVRLTIESVFVPKGATPKPSEILDVAIGGLDPVPANPDSPLPCSSGTGFKVDGTPVPVRLAGTQRDVMAGRNLPLATCDGSPLRLSHGTHDLIAGGVLQADAVSLSSAGAALTQPPTLPSLRVASPEEGRFLITVRKAAGPYYLVLGQANSPGWRASIDGKDVGRAVLLDGYSAGWFVTKTGSYTISVSYGPQRAATVGLVVTGVTTLVALLILSRPVWRRRREQ
jgi:hypothetical protein